MDSNNEIILSLNFTLNPKLHPNKRSSLTSFIQFLPGFVLKVIASHFLLSNFDYFSIEDKNTLKSNTGNLILQNIFKIYQI